MNKVAYCNLYVTKIASCLKSLACSKKNRNWCVRGGWNILSGLRPQAVYIRVDFSKENIHPFPAARQQGWLLLRSQISIFCAHFWLLSHCTQELLEPKGTLVWGLLCVDIAEGVFVHLPNTLGSFSATKSAKFRILLFASRRFSYGIMYTFEQENATTKQNRL